MKEKILLAVLFLLACAHNSPVLAQSIYVDSAATGANTGLSWTDAFSDLQDALAVAEESDEIWVAKGTYTPDAPNGDPAATFLISINIKLLGGFVGTEINSEQRNPANNKTILSGDLNGDDIDTSFLLSRSDNVMNVMQITADITNATIIDGFTIKGGQADGTISSGGGIHSLGSPVIRQCFFTQNFATNWGGGMSVSGTSSQNLKLENCAFSTNQAGAYGGGLDIDIVPGEGIEINQCSFDNNKSARGGGVSCSFTHLRIVATSFTNNSTPEHGGGLWLQGADNITFEIDNCNFENNESSFGGGLYFLSISENCSLLLHNSTFFGNSVFNMGNGYGQGGGGVIVGTAAGAKNTTVSIDSCSFLNNSSTGGGGGVNLSLFTGGEDFHCSISNSYFDGNTAAVNGGAVVFHGVQSNVNDMELVITNSVFSNNNAANQGAAVSVPAFGGTPLAQDLKVTMENLLMTGNGSTNTAGTITIMRPGTLNLLNCTIADNLTESVVLNSGTVFFLQNTILFNPGPMEYFSFSGSVNFISHGGNLIGDSSIPLPAPSDILNGDPKFAGVGDYRPGEDSPCIDAGNNNGVTAFFDLDGNPRIANGTVDIGAYEIFVNPAREVMVGELDISPNPATDLLYLALPENAAPTSLAVFDTQGRLALSQTFTAGEALRVGHLPDGVFMVKVTDGKRVYVGRFIKQ